MVEPRAAGSAWIALTIAAACVEPLVLRSPQLAGIDPFLLLLLRSVVAGVAIVPLTRTLRWIGARAAMRLALASSLLFATSALGVVAFMRLPVAAAVTLVSITPLWVALASARRDRLGARFFGGLVLAVGGIAVSAGFGLAAVLDSVGVLCAIGATFTSAAYRLALERLTHEHGPLLVSSYAYLANAAFALVALTPFVSFSAPPQVWIAGAGIGASAAIANVAFVSAIACLGAARTSLWLLLQRPAVIALAAALLFEWPSPIELAGIAAVLVGLWIARRAPAPREEQ